VELRHVSIPENSFLMHGGKGEATPTLGWIMWVKEGGTQEREEGPPGPTLGWCIMEKNTLGNFMSLEVSSNGHCKPAATIPL
jgi:hypothetical protein